MDGWLLDETDCSFCSYFCAKFVRVESQNSCSLFPQLYSMSYCSNVAVPICNTCLLFFNFVRFVVELRHRQASSHCRSSFFLNRQRLLFL